MKFKLSSPEFDKWNGEDKVLHFAFSASMAFFAAVLARSLHWESPALCGFAASMLVGIAKELKDATTESGSGLSYKDLTGDVLGAGLGVSTAAALLM